MAASKTFNWVSNRLRRSNSKSIEGVSVHALLPSPISLKYHITEDADDDASSIWSLEEIDDNPGPGRLIDKYIYQRLGRMLESRTNRILGPLLVSPYEIGRQLLERMRSVTLTQAGLVPYVLEEPLRMIIRDIEEDHGPGLISGLERLVHGVGSEKPSRRIVSLLQTLIISLNDWCTFKYLTSALKTVLQERTLEQNKGKCAKLTMRSDNFAKILYFVGFCSDTASQQSDLVALRNALLRVLHESRYSPLPCSILSILPIFSSMTYNGRKVSLAAQLEASWLPTVILVWFLSAMHSDITRSSKVVELYNTVEELADMVVSNYILRADMFEKINNYESAERHFKILSLFQLDPVKILLPIASKGGTHKCIFTMNEAIQEMPHEVLYNGEGQLLLHRIYLHARAQTIQLLTSFDRLKLAVENLTEPQGRTTWHKYFRSSILNRGEDLHIDKLPYPERQIRTHRNKNTFVPSTHSPPKPSYQDPSPETYTDASHTPPGESYASNQALRTAILVGVSFGLLLSSAGGLQASESLGGNTQDGNEGQPKDSDREINDGSRRSEVYGDGERKRSSICSLD